MEICGLCEQKGGNKVNETGPQMGSSRQKENGTSGRNNDKNIVERSCDEWHALDAGNDSSSTRQSRWREKVEALCDTDGTGKM